MTRATLIGAGALALAAGAAQADVTPRQVWDTWAADIRETEAQLETEAVEDGDGRLTVRGLQVTSGSAEDRYELRIDELVLEETGDGAVRVTTSPAYPITVRGTDEEGRPTTLVLEVRHPELEMTVSGDGAPDAHDYAAPLIEVELVEATREDAPLEIEASAEAVDVTGRYAVDDSAVGGLDSTFSAAELSLAAAGEAPDGDGTFDISAEMTEVEGDNVSSLVENGLAEMAGALREGRESGGTLRFGPSSYTIAGTDEGEAFDVQGRAASGEITVSISADGLVYSGRNRDSRLILSGDQIPVPELELAIAESAGELTMPVLAEDEAQPFGLLLRLDGVTMGENLWAMLDPSGALPRDPATLVLDLDGTARVDHDLVGDAPPDAGTSMGEIETLSLAELLVRAVGAELTGTGEVELRDLAPGAEDDLPQPVGEVDLRLRGGNALIDRLTEMGLITRDQAPAMRMMLGLFARPVEGEDDVMTSTIEFTEDGGILANGQRLN